MTTLLAIGDMHLGRLPAALPDELQSRRRELGPETAWARSVTEAIDRKVDAVVLAGDLVERSRDFFVAYGQLKSGLEKLAAAGIEAVAVAGNHDVHVLPRLAAELDHLHLLGAGGQWESRDLGDITLIGWSFPTAQVRSSPLDQFPAGRPGKPRIGLLHCDRDQADSAYAPVTSRDLEAAATSAWLLGHIHQPDALDTDRPIGYLGSVSALRANEIGARGPWLIDIASRKVKARQLALAPLRFEAIDIDCSKFDSADQLGNAILKAARDRISSLDDSPYRPEALGMRVRLIGQSRISRQLAAASDSLLADARPWQEQSIQCFIHKLTVLTEPELPLNQLARQSDPCGLLARRILALRDPESESYQPLIELGRSRLQPIVEAREFRDLEAKLDDHQIAQHLERAALLTLSTLMSQREQGQ